MIPFRVQVKLFIENPASLNFSVYATIFQRWIQQSKLEGMMIDVADYLHVPDGPGIVFIGDETDYAVEQTGRPGLVTTRKRQHTANVAEQLRDAFRLGLTAAHLLESEPELKGKIVVHTDEAEIRFLDRLQLPNQAESLDLVRDDLQAILGEVYGSTPATFERVGKDARHVFTVAVHAPGAPSVVELLDHLKVASAK